MRAGNCETWSKPDYLAAPSLTLRILARRTGRTKTFYVTRALEERLSDFEKAYEEVLPVTAKDSGKVGQAIAALKTLRNGTSKPGGMSVRDMKESGRA